MRKLPILVTAASLGISFFVFENLSPLPESVTISVDCGAQDAAITNQVTYRRGFVQPIDSSNTNVDANLPAIMASESNLISAVLDLNSTAEGNRNLFVSAKGTLTPNGDERFLSDNLQKICNLGSIPRLPAIVQVSGVPSAAPVSWLDQLWYVSRETATGNFYPLPVPKKISTVQNAVADFIVQQDRRVPGNIWIGTQEPTHTLGFLSNLNVYPGLSDIPLVCADAQDTHEGNLVCRQHNIRRYISYWKPIAEKLYQHGIKVGGIELNSHDTSLYGWAADEIIRSGMHIDYFTIQRYSSNENLMQHAHDAYLKFQAARGSHMGYENVKVAFDRYSYDNGQTGGLSKDYFPRSKGMVDFLHNENEIMQYAEMMYGYSYQITALTMKDSIFPSVLQWLQRAPTPYRPVKFSLPVPGLEAFALVSTGPAPRAFVAILNGTATGQSVSLEFLNTAVFASKTVTIVKGSDVDAAATGGPVLTQSLSALGKASRLKDLTLAPNDFLLISAE